MKSAVLFKTNPANLRDRLGLQSHSGYCTSLLSSDMTHCHDDRSVSCQRARPQRAEQLRYVSTLSHRQQGVGVYRPQSQTCGDGAVGKYFREAFFFSLRPDSSIHIWIYITSSPVLSKVVCRHDQTGDGLFCVINQRALQTTQVLHSGFAHSHSNRKHQIMERAAGLSRCPSLHDQLTAQWGVYASLAHFKLTSLAETVSKNDEEKKTKVPATTR